jgi:integrase
LPRYKHGKIRAPIEFQNFKDAMDNGFFIEPVRDKSFLAFLYWFGVRKSEALERTPEDFEVKDGLLIVDATPKKGGQREPLEVPIDYPYIDLVIQQIEKTEQKRRVWSFNARTAINIVKRAMGERYYPHFFRLNRATRFLEDPTTTLPEMKAWFGWKAAKTVDPYIGYSRRHIHRQRERLQMELIPA